MRYAELWIIDKESLENIRVRAWHVEKAMRLIEHRNPEAAMAIEGAVTDNTDGSQSANVDSIAFSVAIEAVANL